MKNKNEQNEQSRSIQFVAYELSAQYGPKATSALPLIATNARIIITTGVSMFAGFLFIPLLCCLVLSFNTTTPLA